MSIEGEPKPIQEFQKGQEVVIPESYLSPPTPGYSDQKAEGWVIILIEMRPRYGHDPRPYAVVKEKEGSASKHIPLEELKKVNS